MSHITQNCSLAPNFEGSFNVKFLSFRCQPSIIKSVHWHDIIRTHEKQSSFGHLMLSSFDFNVHDQLAYTMTGDQICVWCWVQKIGTKSQKFWQNVFDFGYIENSTFGIFQGICLWSTAESDNSIRATVTDWCC